MFVSLPTSSYVKILTPCVTVRASPVAPVVKNLPANARDARDEGLILGSGRPPGGGHGNPLQYSCLKNPVDRDAWWATIYGVKELDWRDLACTHTMWWYREVVPTAGHRARVLTTESPRVPCPSCKGGHRKKTAVCKPGGERSPDSESASTLNLDFLAFKTVRNTCLLRDVACDSFVIAA